MRKDVVDEKEKAVKSATINFSHLSIKTDSRP